jgi:hypothetical protein
MLINVTSTDQTIDIFISDGELQSVIVGDWGIGSPKRMGGRETISFPEPAILGKEHEALG